MNTQISKRKVSKSASSSPRALQVLKTLSSLAQEEVAKTPTFKVTYISTKTKAKVVKAHNFSEVSTDEE